MEIGDWIIMLEKMKKIIAEQLGVDESNIDLNTSFKDDLDADSLDLFELIMAIEDGFNVEIPSDDVAGLNTVEDVIEYLKELGIDM
jgi:acyl carrier protein